jgi:hypothetical protein
LLTLEDEHIDEPLGNPHATEDALRTRSVVGRSLFGGPAGRLRRAQLQQEQQEAKEQGEGGGGEKSGEGGVGSGEEAEGAECRDGLSYDASAAYTGSIGSIGGEGEGQSKTHAQSRLFKEADYGPPAAGAGAGEGEGADASSPSSSSSSTFSAVVGACCM